MTANCTKFAFVRLSCQSVSSSSSFGCSHSGVATADVFKHLHRRFGSVLRRMPFLMQPTDSRETFNARPFNVFGCTLERNQLRHCAAKPIVQVAIIANTSGFVHQACFDPVTNRVWVGRTTHWATGALDILPIRIPKQKIGLFWYKIFTCGGSIERIIARFVDKTASCGRSPAKFK